jgi:hypothetical protein
VLVASTPLSSDSWQRPLQALVEIGDSLGLRSPLHPHLADTQPIASSLAGLQVVARSAASEEREGSSSTSSQSCGSITVQLLTNPATGELRCVPRHHLARRG